MTVEKSARALATEQVVWAIGSIAQLHRVPFSREILLQAFVPPYGFDQLPRILSRLGLKVRTRKDVGKLNDLRLPCLLGIDRPQISGAAGDGQQDRPAAEIALLVKVDAGVAWIFLPGDESPRSMPCDALLSQGRGTAIECSSGIAAVADPDRPARNGFGFSWFMPVLMRHGKIWRDVLIASLMIQLIALATPLFTQVIIDKVVVHQTSSTLAVIAFALFVFIVFNAALTWVRQYLVLHTGNRVDAQLGVAVFEHLLHLPLRYFEHRPTGVVAARLHAVETIREFVASSLVTLLLDLPFLLIFVGIMFWYSVPLTLMVLVILGLIAGLSIVVAPVFRGRLNHQFMLGARNQAFLTEHIASLETVKSLQMEPQLVRRYRDQLASYLEAGFHTRQIGNTYGVVSGALEQFMTLVVLTAGAWIVMNGGSPAATDAGIEAPFTIGMLVAFQMFAGKLSQPLMRLVGLWQQFQQASISIRRLADIMDAPAEPYAIVPARETRRRGQVEITDLAFRYGDDRPFLYQHLNFTLEAGTTAVVLGPSGSGKSTLAKLLLGFYLPSGGQIRIDGTDIRHLAANELRAYFGVVPQETCLFSGTIYDNLQVANPHATFEMVVQACRMAEIHDTIETLPRGYQTEIGERGTGLSGGQKQRLPVLQNQAQSYASLGREGFFPALQVQDKLREYRERAQDLKAQESTVRSLEAAIGQSQKRLEQIVSNDRSGLQNERVEAEGQLKKSQQEWLKLRHKAEFLELKAPQDGVIKDLATHTSGTVVTPGTILLTLVPEHEPLVAEVQIRNDDVGFVHRNQKARIKLVAYPFQKYGMLDGVVTHIGADAQDAQVSSRDNGAPASGSPRQSYKALVSLDRQSLNAAEETLQLVPGMQVIAEINQGRRTVLEYLLSPVQQAIHDSARER